MAKATIINRVFLVSLLIVFASWSIPLANAAEQALKETTQRARTTDLNSMAEGLTAEDCEKGGHALNVEL